MGGRGCGRRREATSGWRGPSFHLELWALVRLLCAALWGPRGAELDSSAVLCGVSSLPLDHKPQQAGLQKALGTPGVTQSSSVGLGCTVRS